jgi:hypothetical protein
MGGAGVTRQQFNQHRQGAGGSCRMLGVAIGCPRRSSSSDKPPFAHCRFAIQQDQGRSNVRILRWTARECVDKNYFSFNITPLSFAGTILSCIILYAVKE